ncbi:hypothetical protein D3C71_1735480 [compost metagenome]
MACKRPSTPFCDSFTPASGQRISSIFRESMIRPRERSSAPGSNARCGSARLPVSWAGRMAYKIRSPCLASPVNWSGITLLSMLSLPGPRVSTALPLPASPWVSTFRRPVKMAFSRPCCQFSTFSPTRPLNGRPVRSQCQRPSLIVSCSAVSCHGKSSSGSGLSRALITS